MSLRLGQISEKRRIIKRSLRSSSRLGRPPKKKEGVHKSDGKCWEAVLEGSGKRNIDLNVRVKETKGPRLFSGGAYREKGIREYVGHREKNLCEGKTT